MKRPGWKNKTSFKKGCTPWNKGLKGVCKTNAGSFKKSQFKEEKHYFWKGEKCGYPAIHNWLRRNFGVPNKCENKNCKYPKKNSIGKIMIKPYRS